MSRSNRLWALLRNDRELAELLASLDESEQTCVCCPMCCEVAVQPAIDFGDVFVCLNGREADWDFCWPDGAVCNEFVRCVREASDYWAAHDSLDRDDMAFEASREASWDR